MKNDNYDETSDNIHSLNIETSNNKNILHRTFAFIKMNKTLLYKVGLVLLILIISYLIIVKTEIIKKIVILIYLNLSDLFHYHKLTFFVVLWFTIFAMIVLILPFKVMTCFVGIFIINNHIISFLLLLWSCVCASIFIYIVARLFIYDYVYEKIKNNDYFTIIKKEAVEHPWRTSFITRVLYIPTGLKDYILVMVDCPFKPYIISSIIVYSKYILQMIAVAYQFRNIQDLFDEENSWEHKNRFQKFVFVISILVFLIVMGLITYLGYWATQEVKKKHKEQRHLKNEEQNFNLIEK